MLSLDREDVTFPNSTHLFFTPRKSKHPRCLRRFPRLHPSVEPKMACKQMPEDRSRSLSTFPSMGSRIPSSTRYLLNHETGIATVNHRPKSADKSMKFAFPVDRWMRKEWKDDRTRQGIFRGARETGVYQHQWFLASLISCFLLRQRTNDRPFLPRTKSANNAAGYLDKKYLERVLSGIRMSFASCANVLSNSFVI